MPRQSREREIKTGILSAKTAAEFLSLSSETIKRLCANKLINASNVSATRGRKEWRIPAECLLEYCISTEHPVHRDLLEAVKNYRKTFFMVEKDPIT